MNGNLLARYVQGKAIDEPLQEIVSGAPSYYEQDGLGSVTSLSNSAGALANTYGYDSYGKLLTSTGTLSNPFEYTAREFDSETGIYEYRARYYDQSVGRFVSEDPIQVKGGINFYRYVGNSPANMRDPRGLTPTYNSNPPGTYQACICYRLFPFPLGGGCSYECFCEPIGSPIVSISVAHLQATCGLGQCKLGPLCPRFAVVERVSEGPFGLNAFTLLSCVQ